MASTAEQAPVGISATELKRLFDSDERFVLVDTRDRESFESWRLADARQYLYKPHHEFDCEAFEAETGIGSEESVVTICAKGKSSRALAEELAAAGYDDVRYVEDGMRAWSAVYDAVDIDAGGDADIVQIQRRAKGCLGYLVADPEAGVAAAVDPTRHIDEFVAAAAERGWQIERVLDTHIHADHISGGRQLADELSVPYHLGERASDRDVGVDYEPLARNEVVTVGDVDLKAVFTPGHTSGMASYLVDENALLTGDTVFVDSVGRTELQFGAADADTGAKLLYESLHGTILAEPDSVTVLPGHFHVGDDGSYGIDPGTPAATTVAKLRTELPVLELDRASFVATVRDAAPEKPPNYERIIAINRGRASPDDEVEAIELELGPNRCAAE